MPINRKHLKLITIAVFFLGLAVGAVTKTIHLENNLSHFSPLHLCLIFSSGLSLGGIITRIRYENKIEKMNNLHSSI
jgi:hypothetical protein